MELYFNQIIVEFSFKFELFNLFSSSDVGQLTNQNLHISILANFVNNNGTLSIQT